MAGALLLLKRRLLTAIPVMLIVLVFTFVLMENASGDAVDAYLVSIGGGDAGLRDALRQQYGLDGSILARFWLYITSVLRLDLGWSVSFDRPVLNLILERLPNTLLLMASATTLAFLFGTALGIVAGARPGGLTDRLLSAMSLALYSMPGFWLGLVMAIVFAVQLRWLPTSGIETVASGKSGLPRMLDVTRHLVLPVASLGLIYLALFLRVMRTAMAAIWPLEFVLFAQSKGLSKSRIVIRHVARNAALPLITVLGLQSATMLGGSVVIESVFAIPGFGRLAQEAVSGRDTPLLMGIILVSAVFVILVNLAVDLVLSALDPRIGNGGQVG